MVDRWQGHDNGPRGAVTVQQGPLIRIRHPQWTRANPRQDIPIMVFTQEQWGAVLKEEFFVGAGPIGRSELTHNRRYAFALPTGYNFAFPTGYEEVEEILSRHPLHTGCPAGGHHD